MTDIDDDLVLSSSTQAALAEFLAEQQANGSKVQSSPENEEDISIDSFPEDWQVHPPLFLQSAKSSSCRNSGTMITLPKLLQMSSCTRLQVIL